MPTRTTNRYKTYNIRRSGYSLSTNPGFIYYATNSANPTLNYESSTITDARGFDGRFRPCLHQKRSVSIYGSLPADIVLPLNTPNYLTGMDYPTQVAIERASSRMTGMGYGIVVPTGFNWSALDSDAMANMLPSLGDGSSILNFVYELKDFRQLGKSLIRLAQSAYRSLITRISTLLKSGIDVLWDALGSKPWDSKPRKVTASYLAWKFAWAPFVADCKKLWAKLLPYTEKIKQFERRQRQRQQRHWGKTLTGTITGGPSNGTWAGSLGPFSWTGTAAEVTDKGRFRYTATMRYRYYLTPEMLELSRSIPGMLDVFGINGNPAIIWNAIPFSFVVDWFYSVGSYLEKIRVNNVRPIVEISDFCSSVKSERVFKDTAEGKIGYGSYSKNTGIFGVYSNVSYYERRVSMPTQYTFNDTPGQISGTKVALSAALLHQKSTTPPFTMGRFYSGFKGMVFEPLTSKIGFEQP